MRCLLFGLCVLIYACGGVKYGGSDFTQNQSRAGAPERHSRQITHKDDQKSQVVLLAHQQLGKEYKYGKAGPHAFDCSGLTSFIYGECGVDIPRQSGDQAKIGHRLHINDVKEGDLVVFTKGRKVSHVGICIERSPNSLWVIHSTTSKGVIKENVLTSPYWSRRVREGRRIIR